MQQHIRKLVIGALSHVISHFGRTTETSLQIRSTLLVLRELRKEIDYDPETKNPPKLRYEDIIPAAQAAKIMLSWVKDDKQRHLGQMVIYLSTLMEQAVNDHFDGEAYANIIKYEVPPPPVKMITFQNVKQLREVV